MKWVISNAVAGMLLLFGGLIAGVDSGVAMMVMFVPFVLTFFVCFLAQISTGAWRLWWDFPMPRSPFSILRAIPQKPWVWWPTIRIRRETSVEERWEHVRQVGQIVYGCATVGLFIIVRIAISAIQVFSAG